MSESSDEGFWNVNDELATMGIRPEAMADSNVQAYIGARLAQDSNPNMDTTNQVVRAREGLGFLLPGMFKPSADDLRLRQEQGG